MSKKILNGQSIFLNQKPSDLILPLLIYGLIKTKEKRQEKLAAFLPGFFVKKASAQRTQRPTRKETYMHPP